MKLNREKLRQILVEAKHLDEGGFSKAEKISEDTKTPIEIVLVDEGLISDSELGKIIADSFGWRYVDLSEEKISFEAFNYIPELVARTQEIIAFDQTKDKIKIATSDPENYPLVKLVEKQTGLLVEVYFATPRAIEDTLRHYQSDYHRTINEAIKELSQVMDENKVVGLVNLILEYAYQSRASDVHLEPAKDGVLVRFRVDGVMHEVTEYFKELHERIVFRIKILSQLRTDEHAAPQDGKFQFESEKISFDVRVSTVPITTGENVVMRILAERAKRLRLEELGLPDGDLKKVERSMRKPYGMILSAGPTGSGKTTSLYAITQTLNRPEINIMTIEDPVEYEMEGVHQIQVNSKTSLTFANGIRSIVRQDPDVILVGEIRDEETADIAVNAALTGHLLLSSIHANDSATVFPRLSDLKVEPFLIASSVNVVIAQRLVRKICSHCIRSYFLGDEAGLMADQPEVLKLLQEFSGIENLAKVRLYKGEGCKSCGGIGYMGRIGIFEVLEVTDEIKPLISQKASSGEIKEKAVALGMTNMVYNGMEKVFLGITTLAEILRVTKA